MEVDVFMVFSLKCEALFFFCSSVLCGCHCGSYISFLPFCYFFKNTIILFFLKKHSCNHIICLFKKPQSSLLPREQITNSQQSKSSPSLSFQSPFPVTLPHVTSTQEHSSHLKEWSHLLIPKLGKLQAPAANHRVPSPQSDKLLPFPSQLGSNVISFINPSQPPQADLIVPHLGL